RRGPPAEEVPAARRIEGRVGDQPPRTDLDHGRRPADVEHPHGTHRHGTALADHVVSSRPSTRAGIWFQRYRLKPPRPGQAQGRNVPPALDTQSACATTELSCLPARTQLHGDDKYFPPRARPSNRLLTTAPKLRRSGAAKRPRRTRGCCSEARVWRRPLLL